MGTNPAPWEADYELLPCEGLFHEYLEMGETRIADTLALAYPEMQCAIMGGGSIWVGGELGQRNDRVATEPGWVERFGEAEAVY